VIAALSLATDLSIGFDFEHGLRSTLVAVRLAERLDVNRETAAHSYYAGLLQQVGCTADIHLRAKILGDTREVVKNHLMPVWFGEPREEVAALARAPDAALPVRAIHMARKVPQAARVMPRVDVACREVAWTLIERLGLPASIGALFAYVDERWDGKGPTKAKGDGIPLAMRIAHVARDIDVQRVLGGADLAAAVVGELAGSALDPAIAARFVEEAEAILAIDDQVPVWNQTLACEPAPRFVLEYGEIDRALSAMGDFADLVCPFIAATPPEWRSWRAGRRKAAGSTRAKSRRCGAQPWSKTWVGSLSRCPSGRRGGRSRPASGSGSGCTRTTPSGS
jgi:hypothetical protein